MIRAIGVGGAFGDTKAMNEGSKYLRPSRARRPYLCDQCGKTIGVKETYFRDEPHPMARWHRGQRTRCLCTVCVTGHPASEFSEERDRAQLLLPFAEAVVNLPSLLLQTAVVDLGKKTCEGTLVEAVALPWFQIVSAIEKDPAFLNLVEWRRLEEVIAGAYRREGWDEVIITPASGDRGRDIIAVKQGVCAIRIVDQVKAYSPGRRVSANDVRALLGVLSSDPNVSKGFVTTTAEFAPHIMKDTMIARFVPYRLELKDGVALRSWLVDIARRYRSGE